MIRKSDPDRLKKFIETSGASFKQNAMSYIFSCPRCGKKEKVWIRKSDGYFRCYVCAENSNFKGRCEYALSEILSLSVHEISTALYGPATGPLQRLKLELEDHYGDREDDDDEFWLPQERVPYDWPLMYLDANSKNFEKGRTYLYSRGISEDIIRKYDLRFSIAENRVVFPYVVEGVLVGWQARFCGKTEITDSTTGRVVKIPKTLTTVQDNILTSNVMFSSNLDTVNHCVLGEGPFDALKAELCGGNVASLGKGVTEGQIAHIAAKVSKIYLALDRDAGKDISRIKKIALKLGLQPFLMVPPDHREDFGDCTPEEVLECFKRSTPLSGQLTLTIGQSLIA